MTSTWVSDPLLTVGQPVMDSLASHCGNQTFLLCTPYDGRVLCVYKIGADNIVYMGKPMHIQRECGTSRSNASLFLPKNVGAGGAWRDYTAPRNQKLVTYS